MKNRILELCRQRGMSLSEIATRIGIKQSNLSQSLKGNPTIGTLQSIADCLGVKITDLFEEDRNAVSGYLEVNGNIKKIACVQDLLPFVETFGIRNYLSRKVFKKDLKDFLMDSSKGTCVNDSIAAILDGHVLVNVFKSRELYDDPDCPYAYDFYITVHGAGAKPVSLFSSSLENSDGKGNVDYDYMLKMLWADIIGSIDPDTAEDIDGE